MENYCVSCKKYTANKNSSIKKTKQNKLMLLSNSALCGKGKIYFIKNKELHNFDQFKINKTINKFLLTGDKFMAELHLKQPGFTYSVFGSFTKQREIIPKFRETSSLKHLHRNKLDKLVLLKMQHILIVKT